MAEALKNLLQSARLLQQLHQPGDLILVETVIFFLPSDFFIIYNRKQLFSFLQSVTILLSTFHSLAYFHISSSSLPNIINALTANRSKNNYIQCETLIISHTAGAQVYSFFLLFSIYNLGAHFPNYPMLCACKRTGRMKYI